jgi:eukaryotic-like serine/threonine-protein kinase
MSPEQATGEQRVGPATDTYALGCVLYEMLVGEPPYTGATAQAILGRIILGVPASATEHRSSVPAHVDGVIRKALEKLPADRFSSAQKFASALGDEHFRYGELAAAGGAGATDRGHAPFWRRALPWGLTTALAVTLLVVTSRPPEEAAPKVVRFSVPIAQDDDVILAGGDGTWWRPISTSVAISPDGDVLVYSAMDGADTPEQDTRLYSRRLDQARAEPIEGTEGAWSPCFSPDGAWIGFFQGVGLRRVSMADRDIETIVAQGSEFPRGVMWGDDGTIVFATHRRLYRVSATGGEQRC